MKNITCILVSALLLIGCSKQRTTMNLLLDNAERAIEINPDSAQILLDSIPASEKLKDKSFARWCMLSGKITDLIYNALLPAEQFERAYEWYSTHGTPTEKVQILIYLGRSYVEDGDYDKAMNIYTDAIEITEKNSLNNFTGYIYCYMGDLYEMRTMIANATSKYKTAAEYFKKAKNTKSYVCALRDIGRGYARIDSIECALNVLLIADSIALSLEDTNVKATIDNTLGNTYLIKGEYEKAKDHFSEALKHGKNKLPNYIALIKLYIQSDSISKAKDLLKKIPGPPPICIQYQKPAISAP